MLEVLFWILLGIIAGCITGLIPGIHPNLAIVVMVSLAISLGLEPLHVALFLVSAGVVNSFVDYIPSIFLGAPEEGTALSVLPGHRLLMKGRALEAIKLTVIGGIGSVILGIILLPLLFLVIPYIYEFIKPIIHWILIFIVSYMIFTERGIKNILIGSLVFFLAGFLGMISLNYSGEMIFPLLSGIFGLPILLLAVKDKTSLPKKFTNKSTKIGKKNTFFSVITGTISGMIVGLLPGIGAAQATLIAQEASGSSSQEVGDRKFLISTGCVNTSNMIFSLIAILLIGKGRSGLAVAVGNLIEIDFGMLLLFIPIILLSTGIGSILTMKLSKLFLVLIKKVNYQMVCISIFVLISILVVILTGIPGILVCIVGLCVGMVPNLAGVKKSHGMGCLLLNVIIFFFML